MLPPEITAQDSGFPAALRGEARPASGAGMHRSEAEGRFGEAEPEVMTRPKVASQSEVARGLCASVCSRVTVRNGSAVSGMGIPAELSFTGVHP